MPVHSISRRACAGPTLTSPPDRSGIFDRESAGEFPAPASRLQLRLAAEAISHFLFEVIDVFSYRRSAARNGDPARSPKSPVNTGFPFTPLRFARNDTFDLYQCGAYRPSRNIDRLKKS